jgi:hypothetical protein
LVDQRQDPPIGHLKRLEDRNADRRKGRREQEVRPADRQRQAREPGYGQRVDGDPSLGQPAALREWSGTKGE